MSAWEQTRRLQIVYVPEHEIWTYYRKLGQGFLSLPVIDGLPEDAKVVEVRHTWDRKAFAFLITSPSFPEVPEGDMIPAFPGQVTHRVIKLVEASNLMRNGGSEMPAEVVRDLTGIHEEPSLPVYIIPPEKERR